MWERGLGLLLVFGLLSGCNRPIPAAPTLERAETLPRVTAAAVTSRPARLSPVPATSSPATPTETVSPTPSPSPAPTATFTPSPMPTWAVLRAEVLQQANCRYGPGWMYLYKYGLYPGYVMEVIGRLDDASWLWVRAIGGDNPCWVKADLLDVRGDPRAVEPVYPEKAPLPISPYFPPLGNVQAVRKGDRVTITWAGRYRSPGFSESPESPLYVAEIWACEDGQLRFTPYGLFTETLTVTDQPGCTQPSHGWLYFAEKHGYAGPSLIPWPSTGGTPDAAP